MRSKRRSKESNICTRTAEKREMARRRKTQAREGQEKGCSRSKEKERIERTERTERANWWGKKSEEREAVGEKSRASVVTHGLREAT